VRSARRPGPERGQATVELALCLPLVLLAVLLVVQVGLVVRDQLRVVHAAREAARQAAVDPSVDGARAAAIAGARLDAGRTTVQLSGGGGPGSRITAVVAYRAPTDVPLVGSLVPDPTLKAEVTMRVEG